MASLPNKLVAQVAFKAGGYIFYEIMANNPKHLSYCTPGMIESCDVHQGAYGVNGSVIEWKYAVDGKPQSAREVIQLDKEKKQITYKVIDGDLCELYKNMMITFYVGTKDGIDYITWTIDYELIAPENPHPVSLLNFFIGLTKGLETHIFG